MIAGAPLAMGFTSRRRRPWYTELGCGPRLGIQGPVLVAGEGYVMDSAAQRGELSKWVFDQVRELILDGTLPAGAPLRERELSAELEVSRVPIREALPMLAAAGLVTLAPRRPAVVTTVTKSGVNELYDVRSALEPLAAFTAARSVAAGGDPTELLRAVEDAGFALQRDDLEAFHIASGMVHGCIESLAQNGLLTAVMDPLRERSNRLNVANIAAHPRLRHEEHVNLADAIARGEAQLAQAVAYAHVEFGRTRVFETLGDIPGYDSSA